jgi:excinuclease ABC subunit B
MEHGITPKAIIKSVDSIMGQTAVANAKHVEDAYVEKSSQSIAADPVVRYMSADAIRKAIDKNKKDMQAAVKVLDFIEAARLRDENIELEKLLEGKV